MKKVLLFGTFDGVHEGHKDLFRQAKLLGEEVIVVIARDATVEKVKNRQPNNTEDLRLQDVLNQEDVTHAQLGVVTGDKYAIIPLLAPNVILLGYDQEVFTGGIATVIEDNHLHTEIVRAQPFHPHKYKSSLINTYLSS